MIFRDVLSSNTRSLRRNPHWRSRHRDRVCLSSRRSHDSPSPEYFCHEQCPPQHAGPSCPCTWALSRHRCSHIVWHREIL
ncbi:hypothetical protein Micbo1qcDRAFT_42795 [Microdochium bolleyi]|uniref:Uncharacterized protein n=1 Tax=Microdochium bolleyi TaxID=196109 RepID=A0A136JAQ6_9PEZI|nr:hypothetical protein Micbo1qcDRAFT_42795 [Microdochium bolleyi]